MLHIMMETLNFNRFRDADQAVWVLILNSSFGARRGATQPPRAQVTFSDQGPLQNNIFSPVADPVTRRRSHPIVTSLGSGDTHHQSMWCMHPFSGK